MVSRPATVRIPVATAGSARCVKYEGVRAESGRGPSEPAGRMALARCDAVAILLDAWPSVFPTQATQG